MKIHHRHTPAISVKMNRCDNRSYAGIPIGRGHQGRQYSLAGTKQPLSKGTEQSYSSKLFKVFHYKPIHTVKYREPLS